MTRQTIVTIRINKTRFTQLLAAVPLLLMAGVLAWAISESVRVSTPDRQPPPAAPATSAVPGAIVGYPARGADLDPRLFALELPPPPLDALPYEVREPLSNGESVPVKLRWLWLPPGTAVSVSTDAGGTSRVEVPAGALWWKEFYMETDRGVFLMERRIIQRTPDGWAYFTAHAPAQAEPGIPLVLASTSPEAARFMYSAADWLPTRNSTGAAEVHFHDARGIVHSYVFPGQTQCTVCHAGAAGAYPNLADDPIQIFGLHPANLTRTSYDALAERGWITGGGMLHASTRDEIRDDRPLDALTGELVAILRNNCASCHNAAPGAAASFTAFVIDPNRAYSAENLIDLLGADSRMMGEAGYPLVTAGSLEESEIWLRLNGLHGRRRMPPLEGGLPQPDPRMLDLWRAWILAWHRDT